MLKDYHNPWVDLSFFTKFSNLFNYIFGNWLNSGISVVPVMKQIQLSIIQDQIQFFCCQVAIASLSLEVKISFIIKTGFGIF